MKIYNCDVCGELIYFENSMCVNCGSPLGYLPLRDNMSSLEQIGDNLWKTLAPIANGAIYRKCENYFKENVCNWMVNQENESEFCRACRFNDVIPDLRVSENREYWHRLEIAKRRLIYSLLRLGLPLKNKKEDPEKGLEFNFMADKKGPTLKESLKVLTGHDKGKITMNVAEANDAVREKMRLDMNERYRTLLGHFRHEIGHYYWFLLIEGNQTLLPEFRNLFGDEQQKYDKTLKHFYADGPPTDWQQKYVSAYASAHPWEDWAESWAHYLHMQDALETARIWGLTVKFQTWNQQKAVNLEHHMQTFEEMRDQWVYLSTVLNSLNRSMGMPDVYPFVWSEPVIEKLRFIQKIILQFEQPYY